MRRALPLILAGLLVIAAAAYLLRAREAHPEEEAQVPALEENASSELQAPEIEKRAQQREGRELESPAPGGERLTIVEDPIEPLRRLTEAPPLEMKGVPERVSGSPGRFVPETPPSIPVGGSSASGGRISAASVPPGVSSGSGKSSAGVSGPMLPGPAAGPGANSTDTSEEAAASAPEPLLEDAEDEEADPADHDRDQAEESPLAPAWVWLSASNTELGVGALVEIVVHLADADEVSSVPFHLEIDRSKLAFAGSREGGLLASDGHATVFMAAPSSAGDRVVVGLSRLGRAPGIHGTGILCALSFEAIGPGRAAIRFSRARVVRASGELQPSEFSGLELHIFKRDAVDSSSGTDG